MMAEDSWQWALVGVDALVLYFLRRWYQSQIRSADEVEAAPTYEINEELLQVLKEQPDQHLPYACVEGVTQPKDRTLHSQFNQNEEGVLQKILFVEHKSKRSNGYWSDVKKIIKDQVNVRPFSLRGETNTLPPILVEVTEPMSADFLMDSLTTTYDNYVPNSDTLLSRGIDRLFGEVSKGYQETEKMLSVGVNLLGIGKIALAGGKLVLEPPDLFDKRYILTTMSKKQIVMDLRGDARMIKVLLWIFGLMGAGLVGYLCYRNFRSLLQYIKDSRVYREIEQQRIERRRQLQCEAAEGRLADTENAGESDGITSSNNCVICMTNPREVVLLECGHICICAYCVRILPEPRTCPICRGNVSRFVSTYRS